MTTHVQQINQLSGNSGVGNYKFYNGGASIKLQVCGTHDSSENPKGILEIEINKMWVIVL